VTAREQTPEEVAAHRQQLLETAGWTSALLPGICARCNTPFTVGTPIAYEGHALGWRAACCSAVTS
jgi:hypothetical protein